VRKFVAIVVSFAIFGCSSDEPSSEDTQSVYAPCYGEPGACGLATVQGGSSGPEYCLCTHYCEVATDCPTPATGSAVPICKPYGDVVVNGHTAECSLPCDSNVICPDGMECNGGECWAPITN